MFYPTDKLSICHKGQIYLSNNKKIFHLVYDSFGWMPRQNILRTCNATKRYGKVLNSSEVPVIRISPLGKPIIIILSELKHLSN